VSAERPGNPQEPEVTGDEQAEAAAPRRRRRAARPEAEGAAVAAQETVAEAEEPAREEEEAASEPVATPAADAPVTPAADAPVTPAADAPATPAAAPRPRRRDQRPDRSGVVVRAQAKYVRTSARKARLVCDHIRGKDVEEARAILAFTPRAAAEAWSKLLESAVANAEHNHELVGDELRILAVHADEGPTLKRFRPRAMGRATRIRKRTSHLTIALTPKE